MAEASPAVVELAAAVESLVAEGVLPVGLDAGERPVADVAVLLELLPRVEAVLGMRMARAEAAGGLPFMAAGGMAAHRWWARSRARGLSRAGHLANRHPAAGAAWTAGTVTGDHLDAAAMGVHGLPEDRATAVLDALEPLWGCTTPADIRRFCVRARAIVDPPADPDERAIRARSERYVSFAVLDDTVHISGQLARLDGELLMNTLRATAESLRVAGDGVTAAQRRADALMVLAAGDATHGAVAVTITADGQATTSGGYLLTPGETRQALCDPELTTIVTAPVSLHPNIPRPRVSCEATSHAAVRPDPTEFGTGPPSDAGGGPAHVIRRSAGGVVEADVGPPGSGGSHGSRIPVPRCPGPGGPDGPDPHPAGSAGESWTLALARLAAAALAAPQPLAVGRAQRIATTAQRRALALRDRGCIMPGCEVPAEHCQIHHCTAWTDGGATDLPNLATLCWAHHREVDLGRWDIHPEPAHPTAGVLVNVGEPADRVPPARGGTRANHGAPFTITSRPRRRWGR